MRVISGLAYQFNNPQALASSGTDVFVVDGPGAGNLGALTELDASTGGLVRVISGSRYKFDFPDALAVWAPTCSWSVRRAARSSSWTPRRGRW